MTEPTAQESFEHAKRLRREKKFNAAQNVILRALKNSPHIASLWDEYGRILYAKEAYEACVPVFRKANALGPTAPRAFVLAEVSARLRRYGEAVAWRAPHIADHEGNEDVMRAQARDLRNSGQLQACVAFAEALEAKGHQHDKVILQKAFAQLSLGDYIDGFRNYEYRIPVEKLTWKSMTAPRWAGEDLDGKTILAMPEQGFGDTVMTARFLPLLQERGARVLLYNKPPLRRLMQAVRGVNQAVTNLNTLPPHDYYVPLFSLPHLLGITADTLPKPTRMALPVSSKKKAQARTAPFQNVLKVGIIWTSNSKIAFNVARSIPLPAFAGIAGIPGVQLFSLAKGDMVNDLDTHNMRATIIDASSQDTDLADAAATISEMDLLVTSDTAVVHIAASMGTPVWNLLPHESFWFYGASPATTTPWYSKMRIYRQPQTGDWTPVFEEVDRDIKALLAERFTTVRAARNQTADA